MSEEEYTLKFNLQPIEPISVFALQIGGFFPLCFTSASIILVDRNIINAASNFINGGNHKDNQANEWWLKFLDSPSLLLSPAFYALEGSTQKIPTFDEFCSEFDKGQLILKKAFPKAIITMYQDEHYQGAYALVSEATLSYESDIEFLTSAAPLLVTRSPSQQLHKIEDNLLALAKKFGLRRPTLSLLACLSCLYEDSKASGPSIGRAILKPKIHYTRKMAHNAVMDFCALSLLIQSNAKLSSNVALCTADKGLVRLWCALKVKPEGSTTPEGFNVNFEFTKEMFSNLRDNEIFDLRSRIMAYDF